MGLTAASAWQLSASLTGILGELVSALGDVRHIEVVSNRFYRPTEATMVIIIQDTVGTMGSYLVVVLLASVLL